MVVIEIDGRQWKRCECCHRYIGHHDCKFCGKSYKTPGGLRRHEVACYLNPERQCPLCKGESWYWNRDADAWLECWACVKAQERRNEDAAIRAQEAELDEALSQMDLRPAAQGKGE